MNKSSPSTSNNHPSVSRASLYLFALLMASFIAATFPVWKGLINAWSSSDEYSHGFFIVPLCGYIIWRKKEVLAEIPINPSRWGLALVIFSLLLYLFAHLAEIATVKSFSMVLILAGVIIYFYGLLMFKETLFVFFLLLFMIPVPAQIYAKLTIPLQLFVSKSSVWIAANLAIPVYREGNVIHLPEITLQVVQACSGLRSIIALLTLSAIFGYFTLNSNLLKAILFFCGIPAAIIVNIIRVLLMLIAFHYFSYDLTTGSTHTVFGMVIFFLALILIIIARKVLSTWDTSSV